MTELEKVGYEWYYTRTKIWVLTIDNNSHIKTVYFKTKDMIENYIRVVYGHNISNHGLNMLIQTGNFTYVKKGFLKGYIKWRLSESKLITEIAQRKIEQKLD